MFKTQIQHDQQHLFLKPWEFANDFKMKKTIHVTEL